MTPIELGPLITRYSSRRQLLKYCDVHTQSRLPTGIFWLGDDSLTDTASLPDPAIIAADMVADLESALEQLRLIAADLEESEVNESLTNVASEVEEP